MRELRPDADVWGGFISEAPDLLAVLTGAYVFLKEALLEKQVMTFMTLAPDLETDRVLNLTGAALDQLQVSGESSLIGLVDRCATRFGSRLLRRWVLAPLQQAKDIQSRQDAVAYLVDNLVVVRDITAVFRRTPDLERVTAALWRQSLRSSRGAVYYTSLPDKLTAQAQRLVRGYVLVADAMECLRHSPLSHIMGADYNAAVEQLRDVDSWVNSRVEVACLDGARSSVGHTVKESLIPRAGISAEFDAATARIRRLHHQLEECRVEAQAKWKINAKFVHRKFWFELECADIPNAVRREVTLTSETRNALRFRTSEIEELVRELQAAYQEQVDSLHPFNQELLTGLYGHRLAFEAFTALAAQVDCLMSLAKLSADASLGAWCRPQFVPASSHGAVFDARDSWHPLVCSTVPHFVSNDILLNVDEQPAGSMIITGPNIGGKSTVLRQACCLVILAQIGGFVPARSFALTPVDRIYTRLGVRDSILEGKSTFVVELQEALEMVRGAGTRSLCVLDEFGRGTSTCDGAAMAGAVLRRLSSSCRCLFATHFHPVSKLCETWSRCSNYRMASTVDADELRFLYKLEKGRSPQSFGIEVARSCGLPDAVVQTANDVTQTT
ncbi:MAG: hypothetical protein KVP17_001838 [Porospora cf. gigantea B]|nr:MAG: hypothetical protein KVP17_001838 [Porospora cf. gigantea B]